MNTKTAQLETPNAPAEKSAKKIRSISVTGRRWFDKINGNTYHSATTLINGEPGPSVSFQYGYGNQYEYNAAMILNEAGIIQLENYGEGKPKESLWRYCERNKINYACQVFDLPRKRDVKNI